MTNFVKDFISEYAEISAAMFAFSIVLCAAGVVYLVAIGS